MKTKNWFLSILQVILTLGAPIATTIIGVTGVSAETGKVYRCVSLGVSPKYWGRWTKPNTDYAKERITIGPNFSAFTQFNFGGEVMDRMVRLAFTCRFGAVDVLAIRGSGFSREYYIRKKEGNIELASVNVMPEGPIASQEVERIFSRADTFYYGSE